MTLARVLVLDNDPVTRRLCADHLEADGYEVEAGRASDSELERLAGRSFEVIVSDPPVEPPPGVGFLARIGAVFPDSAILVVSRSDSAERAVASLHAGALDYLVKPVVADRLRLAVQRAVETRRLLRENERLASAIRLYEHVQRMRRCLDPAALYEIGVEALIAVSRARAGAIVLPDGVVVAAKGDQGSLAEAVRLFTADGTIGDGVHCVALPGFGAGAGAVGLALPPDTRELSREVAADVAFLARQLADAAEIAAQVKSVRDLLERDELTDLYNARALAELLERQLGAAAAGDGPSVLFLDVDRFKEVNDRHGHLVGSRVLVELGVVLKRAVRDVDAVARFGGDEFILLLARTGQEAAAAAAERIRSAVESHSFLARESLRVAITVTIGVATAGPGRTADDLVRSADEAMYRGKSASRNVVVLEHRTV